MVSVINKVHVRPKNSNVYQLSFENYTKNKFPVARESLASVFSSPKLNFFYETFVTAT
jgi:hypothetical protein